MNVERILSTCKFSRRHRGTYTLRECICMVLENEEKLLHITDVYSEVGEKYRISGNAVERNIRTALAYAWMHGAKEQMETLFGNVIYEEPAVSELVELFAIYLKDKEAEYEIDLW